MNKDHLKLGALLPLLALFAAAGHWDIVGTMILTMFYVAWEIRNQGDGNE